MKVNKIILLFILMCSATAFSQQKLTISAFTPSGSKMGCGAQNAVDGNAKTYYSNDGRANQPFILVVQLGKTAKAIKVNIKANKKGITIRVNGDYYTRTLAINDDFYIIDANGFKSFDMYGNGTEEFMCYEVSAVEYDIASTTLGLTYDAAGNCTKRSIILNTNKSATIDSTEIYAENIDNKKITIYPNPTRGTIAVVCEGECGDDGEYRLFDNGGNQLRQGTWLQAGTSISMDDYPQGIYILQLLQNGKTDSYTIIKQ